jgi:hypothetical protein
MTREKNEEIIMTRNKKEMVKELNEYIECGADLDVRLAKNIIELLNTPEYKTFEQWLEKAMNDETIKSEHRNSFNYYSSQELELWEIIFNAGQEQQETVKLLKNIINGSYNGYYCTNHGAVNGLEVTNDERCAMCGNPVNHNDIDFSIVLSENKEL